MVAPLVCTACRRKPGKKLPELTGVVWARAVELREAAAPATMAAQLPRKDRLPISFPFSAEPIRCWRPCSIIAKSSSGKANYDAPAYAAAVARLQVQFAKLHTGAMKLAWDDIRYFLAFTRAGSMQAAAKALRVNQSTVQRRITELEGKVGRRLVERHLGSYRLTALGEEMRPLAESIDADVRAFDRHLVASDKDLTGTIRVTCGSILAARLGRTQLIQFFHARHPGLRVELVISDRFLDLSKGEADVAIRLGEPQDESLVG